MKIIIKNSARNGNGRKPVDKNALMLAARLFGEKLYRESFSACPKFLSEYPPVDCEIRNGKQIARYICNCGNSWEVEYPLTWPLYTLINWLELLPSCFYYKNWKNLPLKSLIPADSMEELKKYMEAAQEYLNDRGYYFNFAGQFLKVWREN
ncbi:hypothetical protein GFC01_14160 [Desulfofundulus thermobenzoicus]|uniref:Uncharacterized protein n=1 Tax=Desulfofundulus thermobenzoicus TaxID=29376 RepID=A0A6N7IU00_9FIRM|nr:hypothetical protein [Desulfofundulus thermobenzoicus]MQL53381.1 hypothetical protein [Desulfofundulus thermobenzoicus]